MLSVLSLFILFPVVFSVAFWSSFAYARTILYIFLPLFTTKSDTFFLLPHHKKVRGRRKLTFRLQLSIKSLELKYYFDRECKMNPLLST